MTNVRNESLMSQKERKRVAKEKRPPRRGLGVARLEKLRILDEELAAAASFSSQYVCSFVPPSYFPPPFTLQGFYDSGSLENIGEELDSFGMECKDLSVQSLDACPHYIKGLDSFGLECKELSPQSLDACPHSIKKRREQQHITARDLSLTIIPGEGKRRFQITEGEDFERGDAYLDLSLSSIYYGDDKEGNLSIKEDGADSRAGAMTPKAVTHSELLTYEWEGIKNCNSSTALASYCRQEPCVLSLCVAALDSPPELNLGLSL
ncbi:hypothetical protein AAC387_Pa11g1567 [Persea americana]